MDSINCLINLLITSNKKEIRNMIVDCYDVLDIIKKYKKDSVPQEKLILLINRSVGYKDLQYFLTDIFSFIDAKSITDDVLDVCLHYPGNFKKTLLIQLAHLPLREGLLMAINKRIDSTEAFYQLFLLYLFDKNKTSIEMKSFLIRNKSKLYAILNYKVLLKGRKIEQCKINTIDLILSKYREVIDKNTIKI